MKQAGSKHQQCSRFNYRPLHEVHEVVHVLPSQFFKWFKIHDDYRFGLPDARFKTIYM